MKNEIADMVKDRSYSVENEINFYFTDGYFIMPKTYGYRLGDQIKVKLKG